MPDSVFPSGESGKQEKLCMQTMHGSSSPAPEFSWQLQLPRFHSELRKTYSGIWTLSVSRLELKAYPFKDLMKRGTVQPCSWVPFSRPSLSPVYCLPSSHHRSYITRAHTNSHTRGNNLECLPQLTWFIAICLLAVCDDTHTHRNRHDKTIYFSLSSETVVPVHF